MKGINWIEPWGEYKGLNLFAHCVQLTTTDAQVALLLYQGKDGALHPFVIPRGKK